MARKQPAKPPEVLPVSKSDAAAEKKVTRGAVSLACREGGPLHAALLDGGRLDSAHPAYRSWLAGERKGGAAARAPTASKKSGKSGRRAPTPPAKSSQKQRGKPTAAPPTEAEKPPAPPAARVPTDDELTGLLQTFGTHRNLSDSLKLRKAYVDLSEKELRLKEAKGLLVKREILVTIVAAFDQAFHQLLTDLPKTATRELYTMARGGKSLEEAELKHKELVSSHLTTAKEQVRQTLRSAHGTPTTSEFPRSV